jgi:hypothetical protein
MESPMLVTGGTGTLGGRSSRGCGTPATTSGGSAGPLTGARKAATRSRRASSW